MDFYEVLDELNPNQRNVAMTVLEGDDLGEKALFTDDKLFWSSKEAGFFQSHIQELEEIESRKIPAISQGIIVIDGIRVFFKEGLTRIKGDEDTTATTRFVWRVLQRNRMHMLEPVIGKGQRRTK